MFTATADLILPSTTTGSFPRPRWFDISMWGRPLDTCMLDVRFRDIEIRAENFAKPPTAPLPVEFAPPQKDYAQEYRQSFQGSAALPAGWDFVGPFAEPITSVGADVADALPSAFVAVTTTRNAWPTSPDVGVYVLVVPAVMSPQPEPSEAQRCHW